MECQECFFNAYVDAALWSSVDDDGDQLDRNYSADDISDETLAAMRADCAAFWKDHGDAVMEACRTDRSGSPNDVMAGHDFWLTRCGHGAGFWDGDWPEPYATRLTDASEAFGNVDLYVGDDGKIYA